MKNSIENFSQKYKKEKIQTIIFSRDRAMQLDALLRSLFLHCHDIQKTQIIVLYKTTNEIYRHQYQMLSDEYIGRVSFRKQEKFRYDLIEILNPFDKHKILTILSFLSAIGFTPSSFFDRIWRKTISQIILFLIMKFIPNLPDEPFVLFLVDDNIFVRDFLLVDMVDALNAQNDLIGISLRLGENTTYCYSHNHAQSVPTFTSVNLQILKYEWTKSEYDFGYPLEVSSSLYRLENILPLILGIPFENPNTLEERLAFYSYKFSTKYPFLGCHRLSITFCNPINIVQNVIANRANEKVSYSVNELAVYFSQGKRIEVESYSGFVPNACHQEVKLIFTEN